MKKKLINLFLGAILLLVASPSFANVLIGSFSVKSEYLLHTKLKYNADGSATNFKAVASFNKLGDYNNRAIVTVVLQVTGSPDIILGTAELSANWPASNFKEITIDATLPRSEELRSSTFDD